jgi:hypothetical protein
MLYWLSVPCLYDAGGYERTLILDTLAIHLIRAASNSTVISYHPDPEGTADLRHGLHARAHLIGSSVYWQKIFDKTTDSTFLLLAILWHAVYAWDEALETLHAHVSTLVGTSLRHLETHSFVGSSFLRKKRL